MPYLNNFGLGRFIPERVRREVRQRSGFGCVICGKAIGDYDHLDPPFHKAHEHNADDIVFLCLEHHGLKTRKQLSEETVRYHAANPAALQKGFSFGAFDMRSDRPLLHVGSNQADGCLNFIRINGRSVLSIKPPERPGGPFLLNADFLDREGKAAIQIVDNEWRVGTDNWDVRTQGQRIEIYSGPRRKDVVIRTVPPNCFYVEKLEMSASGFRLSSAGHELSVHTPKGDFYSLRSFYLQGGSSVIDLDDECVGVGVIRD